MADLKHHNSNDFIPVVVNVETLRTMTVAQVDRISILLSSYNGSKLTAWKDSWGSKSIEFNMQDAVGERIVNGLIEADGSCHT